MRRPVPSTALAVAFTLALVAACSGGDDEPIDAASSGEGSTTSSALLPEGSTTSAAAAAGSTTTRRPSATSSTIAYFTVPSSTTEPPGQGGGFEPGESVGRRFTDAVMDGNRSTGASLAPKTVVDQFEPWRPYERKTVDGVSYPRYRYTGGTTRGELDFSPEPTSFIHCKVDRGKITTCAVGD